MWGWINNHCIFYGFVFITDVNVFKPVVLVNVVAVVSNTWDFHGGWVENMYKKVIKYIA